MTGEETWEIEEEPAARRRIIVYLGQQRGLFERLSRLAEETERSASWHAREALTAYLDSRERVGVT